jgi:hypothetical protein
LSDTSIQARSRNIRFSSTVSEAFVLDRELTEELVQAAEEFWRQKGMVIKSIQTSEKSHESESAAVEFVAEGGTIWTTNFDSYKKSVMVNLVSNAKQTEVQIQIVLPGGIMSLQDRERAAVLIDSFYESLQADGG